MASMRDPPHNEPGEKTGVNPISRNGPEGAAQKWGLSPFSGGAGGFEAVVESFESPLLRYVIVLLRCQQQTAEDVVQEVFLRLHRHARIHGHDSIEDVSAWLYKVAHNRALDVVRQSTRQRIGQERLGEQTRMTTQNGDQLADLERREACQRAMAAMHDLPDQLKQVLLLKIIAGMTLRQIAAITGLSVGNAGYRVNKALGILAMKLKEEQVI